MNGPPPAQEVLAPMQDVPYGFCHCGCGERTKIAARTHKYSGWVKGEPKRYVFGHHLRNAPVQYLAEDRGYETPCWIWQWSFSSTGYGLVTHNGKTAKAHRVFYERAKGPIPVGLTLDHLCRVPACVNPDHLEAVTRAENNRRGERTKYNFNVALSVRMARLTTSLSHKQVADMLGIPLGTERSMVQGMTWRSW